MKATNFYPKGSITAVLRAAIATLILALAIAYITNPKPFNHLLDVVFKENLTTKEIVK